MSIRISNVYQAYEAYGAGKNGLSGKASKSSATKDSVAISEQAKDYQAVRKALEGVSDIREDKVNYYKRLIDTNQYSVKPEAVAAKLFSSY